MKQNDIYNMVTERILGELAKGIIPWHRPWTGTSGAWSRSTGKAYSLLNQWMMPKGEYATFNQIKKENGHILKGSKGYKVVFYKPTLIESEDKETGKIEKKIIPYLRYYTVFNIQEQTDLKPKYHTEDIKNEHEPIAELEQIKADYLLRENVGFSNMQTDKAYYNPSSDAITLPLMEQFESIEEYYSTAFHEIAHSTGHPSRLNRINQVACFGSNDYGKEELIAEIAASAILNETGIETLGTFRNSTAYIQNWSNAIKADNKLIIHASSKAQKAFELIMNI